MKKANPIGRTDFNQNISNPPNTSTSKANQTGRVLAGLYGANIGSLDAFYTLFRQIEITYSNECRQAFLDGFFDAVEQVQEGGN